MKPITFEVQNLKTEPVNSSNIKAIGYEQEVSVLQVDFYSGESYQYHPVSRALYQHLLGAKSIGAFFGKNIRSDKSIKFVKLQK